MPPNLTFEFSYLRLPRLNVIAVDPTTRQEASFIGLIDTGADITILDDSIALLLGLSLASARWIELGGIGGGAVRARLALLELIPLGEPELTVELSVAFAPDMNQRFGNLIGRDVLEFLDFGLSHSTRVGYLGRSSTLE